MKLKGQLTEIRAGCVYYDRCPKASKELGCDVRMPAFVSISDEHQVACFAVERELIQGPAVTDGEPAAAVLNKREIHA